MRAEQASGGGERASMVPRILVFYDYGCGFCYLDWPRLKRLRDEHGAELVLAPFELRPQLPAGGVMIADIGAQHSERVEQHMRRLAAEEGLPLAHPRFMPNTHGALTVAEYVRDEKPESHEAVHAALLEAYNGHGRDIGRPEVLLEVASDFGLDTDDVTAALDEDRYGERLHKFYHVALALGINATPSALICNEVFIGSRPYEVLDRALQQCIAEQHTMEAHPSAAHAAGEEQAKPPEPEEGRPPATTGR